MLTYRSAAVQPTLQQLFGRSNAPPSPLKATAHISAAPALTSQLLAPIVDATTAQERLPIPSYLLESLLNSYLEDGRGLLFFTVALVEKAEVLVQDQTKGSENESTYISQLAVLGGLTY